MSELKLVETVNNTLVELIEGDVIKKIISDQIEATIKDIVRDSMRSYSDFGKAISEKINTVIHLAASNVDLPEYTKFVSDVVLTQFDKILHEQSKEQLTELIKSELGEMPEGKITAQQLFNKIKENFETDDHEEMREIKVSIEFSEHDALYITINDEESSEKTRVTLYDHRKKGYQIGYLESGGYNSKNTRISERSFNTHCMDKLEQFLFRLYCAQTVIDATDIEQIFCDIEVGGCEY